MSDISFSMEKKGTNTSNKATRQMLIGYRIISALVMGKFYCVINI